MYEQERPDSILFFMLYAGVMVTAIIASCYLLFRRGNAFAPNIKTPPRLRRWTGIFIASMALSHIWYMPVAYLATPEAIQTAYLIGGLLDCIIVIPLAIIVLLSMLQDRKRPLWPAFLVVAPLAIMIIYSMVSYSEELETMFLAYLLLLCISLIIYMVLQMREYGRWLRDNYADLEHKEVWQSFIVFAIILVMFGIYVSGIGGPAYNYIVNINSIVLICYLLWRVETLSYLSAPQPQIPDNPSIYDNIGTLLQLHCIDTKLYLQHDLTLQQLAKTIGTNRLYLSQYFSRQDTTYNAYINGLRVKYFTHLYREAVNTQRPFTIKELAHDSGYLSYSTFSLAFKQLMGQTVTAWTHNSDK